MVETQTKISKQNKIILFLMALIFAIFFIATPINLIASASTESSSPVLTDLQKDENFNVGDYPAVDNKYELDIIQVAETTTNDFLVYVYMPCARAKELQLTTISISTELDDKNPDFNLYKLSLLNSSGVFFKYLVEGLKPSNDIMRKYNISEVHRYFDNEIDKEAGNNQTITEVPHEIAQTWTTTTINGEVYYQRVNNEVVTIEEKYVGFLRYETSYWLTGGSCDGHFVAFSTDYKIDQLYEADVSFVHRTYKKKTDMGLNVGGGEQIVSLDNASVFAFGDTTWTFGDYITTKKTIKYTDKATIQQGHFITNSYSWNRIESVEEFIEKEDLTNTTSNALKNKQWVLRFHETDFAKWSESIGVIQAYKYESGTQVEDVTILRLKFKTDGKVYNLGVVDNKQTGSGIQDNNVKRTWWQKVWESIVNFLKIAGIAIAVVIAIKLVILVINLIKAILK